MRLTMGKKLVTSFLILALLVLLSGVVGIMVLNKVSGAADMVVKEKVPVQDAVMKAKLKLKNIEKLICDYSSASSGLDSRAKKLNQQLEEFTMWISMLRYGSSSDRFKASESYRVYKKLNSGIVVPKASARLQKSLDKIFADKEIFLKNCMGLVKAQNLYLGYSVTRNNKNYSLPHYLLLMHQDFINWYKALEDAVNIVIPFNGNTDPAKGMIGTWVNTFKTHDKGLKKLIKKMNKYNKKIMAYAVKINKAGDSKGKARQFNRSRGPKARIVQFFKNMQDYIAPIYRQLDKTKEKQIKAVTKSASTISNELESLVKIAENEMSEAMKASQASKKSASFILIVLTVTAVAAAIILGIIISRGITKNVTNIVKVTKKIAEGQLNVHADISTNDELGDLCRDTNAMAKHLRQIISKITEYSEHLTESSTDLTLLASSLSNGAKNMTAKSESVAAAAEEMSTNMNSVAATSEEATANINTVTIATDEINSSINEIAKNSEKGSSITREAVAKAEGATAKVNELGEAAKAISKVTEVISEISEQTNLLALNATIEAARAGEAGKGFAVVASEIKQLALQTAEATQDIRTRIEGIQNSTADTVTEIKAVADIIENVNDIVSTIAAAVEEQSATTKEIADNMGQASGGLQEVSENVAQSSDVAQEIAKDIGDVNTSSIELAKSSEELNINSRNLKQLAGDLQEIVNQFRL